MRNLSRYLYLIIIILILSACETFGPEKTLFGEGRVNTASANQILDKNFESFSDIGLIQLLDPERTVITNDTFDESYYDKLTLSQKSELLNRAFLQANNSSQNLARRSQIQDRLIAASNQRCNLYSTYLTRLSNFNNSIFGTATTILGGAGAIVTGEQAARVLSGLAGITSGSRAELNQAIFDNVASSIIIPGIEKNRAAILKDIMDIKRPKDMKTYTVEAAVADAIHYHGACNINAGIDYAHKSLQITDDVGIKKFNETLAALGVARNLSLSSDFASVSSLVIASDVLNEYSQNLGKLKTLSATHAELLKKIITLEGEIRSNLTSEANGIDDKLKPILFGYSSTKSTDKANYFNQLQTQQNSARTFESKTKNLLESVQLELDKLTQNKS